MMYWSNGPKIRCWSPNVTRSVVMVSWFTHNYCACAPMLYISELCEDCAVVDEIDYAWASIHDNGHVITACDVWLQQRIGSVGKCFWFVLFPVQNYELYIQSQRHCKMTDLPRAMNMMVILLDKSQFSVFVATARNANAYVLHLLCTQDKNDPQIVAMGKMHYSQNTESAISLSWGSPLYTPMVR